MTTQDNYYWSSTLDESRFVLRDYLDPVAIVDLTGAVEERYGYDAFGADRIMDARFTLRTTGSAVEWNWLFHGEFKDSEGDLATNLYNYGYRHYHTQLGRWISRDLIGERGGSTYMGLLEITGQASGVLSACVKQAK